MPPKYPHLPLRVTEDQLRWLDEQAAKAGVSRSKWVKARLFGAVGIGVCQRHGDAKRHFPDDRLSDGRVGVVEKLGAAIHQTLETVPDSGEQYTPSNPLDRVREVAVLSSQLLLLLNQLEPATEREQELVRKVWAIASLLQRKCAIAGRGERRQSGRSA